MEKFSCPVCRKKLTLQEKSLVCENKHLYDISKKGYVNLLMSQKSSDARHGDSKEMIVARMNFLNLGYYEKLLNHVLDIIYNHSFNEVSILDIGCGECYYTSHIRERIECFNPVIYGIDISKDALIYGYKRDKKLNLSVASAFDVPVLDESFDIVLNMFAPHSENEYSRILKSDGILVRVFPSTHHLWEFKSAIYDNPYKNEDPSINIDNFELISNESLTYTIELKSNDEIQSLFKMTPYSYKTSENDERKVESLNNLSTTVDFKILVYKKV